MTQSPATRKKNEDALFDAIIRNKGREVQKLLDAGVSPEVVDDKGRTALFQAASYGSVTSITALLDAGARINRRSPTAQATALNGAIENHQVASAHLLLDMGADPRIIGAKNCSPTQILIRNLKETLNPIRTPPRTPDEAFSLFVKLLDKGNPLDHVAADGETLIADIVARAGPSIISAGAPVRFLRVALERLSAAGKFDERIPHCTWRSDNLNALRLLVAHGGDINTVDRYGQTLIRYAADVDTIDEMVHLGANLNHLDCNGQNALANYLDHDTPEAGKLPKLLRLIDHGIDVDQLDYGGESVCSRLAGREDNVSNQLKVYIAAYKARAVMANAVSRRRTAAQASS